MKHDGADEPEGPRDPPHANEKDDTNDEAADAPSDGHTPTGEPGDPGSPIETYSNIVSVPFSIGRDGAVSQIFDVAGSRLVVHVEALSPPCRPVVRQGDAREGGVQRLRLRLSVW